MIGAKFKKTGHMTPATPIRGSLVIPRQAFDIYTCLQNLATLASAIPEICMIAGIETENESCDPDHAHFRGGLLSIG